MMNKVATLSVINRMLGKAYGNVYCTVCGHIICHICNVCHVCTTEQKEIEQ